MNPRKVWLGGVGILVSAGLFVVLLGGGGRRDLPGVGEPARVGRGSDGTSSRPARSPEADGETKALKRVSLEPEVGGNPMEEKASLPFLEGRVVESGGKGIPGVNILLLKGPEEKGGDPLGRFRRFAARAGEIREKLAKAGPALPPERIASYKKAFLARLKLQVAASARSGRGGRFRFAKVALPRGGKEILALEAEPPNGFLAPDPVIVEPSLLGPGKGPDLVLLRPASVKGMVLAWPEGGKAGTLFAWRLGPGKILEERNRFLFQSLDFELKGLHPGKWRLALLARWGKTCFSWGPLLELHEGERKEGIVLKGETPSSLEVFLYGPGKSPLDLDTRVVLTLLAAGPPGLEGGEVFLYKRLAPKAVAGGEPCSFPYLSPGKFKVVAEMRDMVPGGNPIIFGREKEKGDEKKTPYRVEKAVFLRPGPNQVELVFPKLPGMIDLQVVLKDSSGRPVERGEVRILPMFRFGVAGKSRRAKVGEGGRAFFPGIPRGKFRVRILSPGFWFPGGSLNLSKSQDVFVVKEYTLQRAGKIEGIVLDSWGKPAKGKGVLIIRQRGRGEIVGREGSFPALLFALTGKKGEFSKEVPKGRYKLRFNGVPGWATEKELVVDWGKTVKVDLRIPR